MKKLFIILLSLSSSVFAKHHDIKMMNLVGEEQMMFDPAFLKAEVGDTITFKPTNMGHFVHSKAVPEGAESFASEEDDELTITVTKEGLYVYTCPVHRVNNMNGIIQVGTKVTDKNKAEAKKAIEELEGKARSSEGRLLKIFNDNVK